MLWTAPWLSSDMRASTARSGPGSLASWTVGRSRSLPLRLLTKSHAWPGHDGARRALQGAEVVAGGIAVGNMQGHRELARAQRRNATRSFRGSGEPAWVIASSNACEQLGPDPRRALGPAAIRAASTGRTHDRTRPMLHQRKKALVNQAPSTHDRYC